MTNKDTIASKTSKADKKFSKDIKFEDTNIDDNEIISKPENIDCIQKFFDQKKKPQNPKLSSKLDKLQNRQKTNIQDQDSKENNHASKSTDNK